MVRVSVSPIKLFLIALLIVVATGALSAQNLSRVYPKSFSVTVTNPLNQQRDNVMVLLEEEEIRRAVPAFNPEAFVVMAGKKEIPSQFDSRDGQNKGIALVLDQVKSKEALKLTILYKESGKAARSYVKRTQAELSPKIGGKFENGKYIGGEFKNVDSLRVPAEHTDHTYYIRYEGPGWESDKVGYRFYLDWRNATDVFGKRTPEMVLQQVGLDGFDSYHELQPWGMDVLKVGKSLGVGSLAMFHNGKAIRVEKTDNVSSLIAENGNVYSSILTDYHGWKVGGITMDVRSLLSIHAGSRLTHHQVMLKGDAPQNLSSGLNKDKKAKLFTDAGNAGQWGYLASYGKQSLNNDNLGIAVLFRHQDFLEFSEDEHSHVVQLKPTGQQLNYHFLSAWELEQDGIKTEEQFLQYLDKTVKELANPVQVKFNTKTTSRR